MPLPFKRVVTDIPNSYLLYGKLPHRADFVRINANHPVMLEFDGLIQRALERLSSESDWTQSYDEGNLVEFQYVTRDSRYTLIGALAPSRDQSGRRYPMIAGEIIPSETIAGQLHLAPIAYEVFFDGLGEQVRNAIDNSVEALSCRQFLESHLRAGDAIDWDLANSVVQRFMDVTTVSQFSNLLGKDPRFTTLEQALMNIAFYRAFLHHFDNPATNQIMLFPLPEDKGEQPLIASVWLSILDVLWQGADQKRYWSGNYLLLQHPSSGNPMLAACFGKTPDSFGALMLGKTVEPAVLLDLSNELDVWRKHPKYAEVSYALGRILSNPALSLSALYKFLQDIARQLDGLN